MSAHLLHLFVTVRGIEAHPSSDPDDDSPDWQELAPQLVANPAQLDLMAHAANSCPSRGVLQTVVPAGVYRQMRLRLLAIEPPLEEPSSGVRACGRFGPNCAVTADGNISPLTFEEGRPELRISASSMPDGFFRVLPDSRTNLTIEFNTFSSLAVPSGETLRLIPEFTLATAPSCDSLASYPLQRGP